MSESKWRFADATTQMHFASDTWIMYTITNEEPEYCNFIYFKDKKNIKSNIRQTLL